MKAATAYSNKTAAKAVRHTKDLTCVALAVGLISVCSWISVPTAVPFTLQTFAVFATMSLLGGKRGTIAIVCYILLGLTGAPVFSRISACATFLGNPSSSIVTSPAVSARTSLRYSSMRR